VDGSRLIHLRPHLKTTMRRAIRALAREARAMAKF
jgi:hypothetical protein